MADTTYILPDPEIPKMERWQWGPLMWGQLHARPGEMSPDPEVELRWLYDFADNIPCADCRQHFRRHLERYPADFSTPAAYRMWSWGAHNVVRYRQGKKMLPWDTEKWGEPPYPIPPFFNL